MKIKLIDGSVYSVKFRDLLLMEELLCLAI